MDLQPWRPLRAGGGRATGHVAGNREQRALAAGPGADSGRGTDASPPRLGRAAAAGLDQLAPRVPVAVEPFAGGGCRPGAHRCDPRRTAAAAPDRSGDRYLQQVAEIPRHVGMLPAPTPGAALALDRPLDE